MANQTSADIDIAAPPERVMAVIADLPAYPEWVDSLTEAEVLEESDGRPSRVRMRLEHPVIKDSYELGYDWAEDEVSWHLIQGGKLTAMDGSYELRPIPGQGAGPSGTNVTYRLSVDVNLPLPGMLRRKAEKTIIDGALKGLKRRVEG